MKSFYEFWNVVKEMSPSPPAPPAPATPTPAAAPTAPNSVGTSAPVPPPDNNLQSLIKLLPQLTDKNLSKDISDVIAKMAPQAVQQPQQQQPKPPAPAPAAPAPVAGQPQ